jgi:hypothetical protein
VASALTPRSSRAVDRHDPWTTQLLIPPLSRSPCVSSNGTCGHTRADHAGLNVMVEGIPAHPSISRVVRCTQCSSSPSTETLVVGYQARAIAFSLCWSRRR